MYGALGAKSVYFTHVLTTHLLHLYFYMCSTCCFHIYADDDNLYLAFKPLGISSAFISVEYLISLFWDWMIVNMLGINDTKTNFTVINGP